MHFKTIIEALAFRAEYSGDNIFLIESVSGKRFTYSQTLHSAFAFSNELKATGVVKGSRVVIRVVQSDIGTVIAMLGVYLCGAICCPLESGLNTKRVLELLNYYETKFLISSECVESDCIFFDITKICEKHSSLSTNELDFLFPDSSDLCDIIFTTGTTGKAKGVMLSYDNRMNAGLDYAKFFNLTEADILLKTYPIFMVGFMRWLCAASTVGATVVLFYGGGMLSEYTRIIKEHHVTILEPSGSIISMFLKCGDAISDWSDLRYLALMTKTIPYEQWNKTRQLLPNTVLYNTLGPTEAGLMLFYNSTRDGIDPNCLGTPQNLSDVVVVDDDYLPMISSSAKTPGTIAYNKEKCMRGYWKSEGLTQSVFHNNLLISTDYGYLDERGYIHIFGRHDDVINSGGYKIAPYEIEEATRGLDEIEDCVCVPLKNDLLGEIVCLFVVLKAGEDFDYSRIHRWLTERIESYKLPRKIIQIDAIPLIESTGKTDKKQLIKSLI